MYLSYGARKMIAHKTNYFIKLKYSCSCKHWKFQGQTIPCVYESAHIAPYNFRHASRYSFISSVNLGDVHSKFLTPSVTNLLIARNITVSNVLYESEPLKPSSKVEESVKSIKQKIEEEKLATEDSETAVKKVVVKKSIKQKIIDELKHYYHGFKLLFIDINVSRKLLMRILNGKTLTRREHNLLIRTTADVFRLIPFSVFIIVPFMEFLLPVFIKFFPGMLPSTFETKTEKEDKMRQSLKVKLEMAKFLQKTLDQMAPQSMEDNAVMAQEFSDFFTKIRTTGEQPTNEDILKFSKMFEDEITLDSLPRPQLIALCRVLEIYTIGNSTLLRFNIRMKLRSLAADDKMIAKEGVESLTLSELQQACKARAMRAYGMPEERLRSQLKQWLDLSLNEKIPQVLLLMSRALMIPQNVPTTDKLKASISVLPENLIASQTAAISEKEGRVDHKAKIQAIKEEQRKIEEEREERREERLQMEAASKDKAPVISADTATPELVDKAPVITNAVEPEKKPAEDEVKETGLSKKEIVMIEGALSSLGKNKKKLLLEKEELADLKVEMADYHEDVQELKNISKAEQINVRETKGAKRLAKKVDSIIMKLNDVLANLESEKVKQMEDKELSPDQVEETKNEVVHIEELMDTIKQITNVSDETKIEHIKRILGRLDDDFDGQLKVDDVYKVIETIGKENVQLNEQQVGELVDLLGKEEIIDVENRIQKALQKELELETNAKEAAKTAKDAKESERDAKKSEKDNKDANESDKIEGVVDKCGSKPAANETLLKEAERQEAIKEAIEKQKEQIVPKIPPIEVQPKASADEVKKKESAEAGPKA